MASLLPNAKQQFLDIDGVPLASGYVYFYIPGTTTPKDTWQDASKTILNTNPISLDAAGEAVIYGTGAYRQVLKDYANNLVWDQNTADTAQTQSSWAGVSGGSANAQTVSAPNFNSVDGQIIQFVAGFTNPGAATVNPNGVGTIPVVRDALTGPVVLVGGEIVVGNVITLAYTSTTGKFHLTNAPPSIAVFGASGASHSTGVVPDPGAVATTVRYLREDAQWQIIYPLAGMLAYFPGRTTAPTGFLKLNGALVSRVTYADLWAYAQVDAGLIVTDAVWLAGNVNGTFSSGDTTTTFRLPDYRGEFIRGLDDGRGIDTGRVAGSFQNHQLQDHAHTLAIASALVAGGLDFSVPGTPSSASLTTTSVPSTGLHGTETRARNLPPLACIRI